MRKSLVKLLLSGALAACTAAGAVEQGNPPAAEPQANVVDLSYDVTGERLLKVYPKHLYQSSDGGKSWQAVPLPALENGQLATAATPATRSNVLYIAGPGIGVRRSDDAGQTWQALNEGLPSRDVTAFTVHRSQPETLYAFIPEQGIYRSEDAGQSWRKVGSGPVQGIEQLVHSDMEGSMQTGWLIAISGDAVRLSMDCFCGWRPAGELPAGDIYDVTYDLSQPKQVYVATQSGVYRSRNGGQEWEQVSAGGEAKVALAFAPSGVLFAITRDGVVLRSEDQGQSWEEVDA